jgi:selenocysteine lyase/cysteine desulfurase
VVAPLTPDRARLKALREGLPAVGAGIYLNTASAGPLPAETSRAMADEAAREATLGRAHDQDPQETVERVGEARAAVAAVLAADLEAVALTHGTAHGLLLACTALPWRPGDRAVVLTGGTGWGPWPFAVLEGLGVDTVKVAVENQEPRAVVAAVERALEPGARLLAMPHVLATNGALLPAMELAEVAHAGGALIFVDGSLSVGAIPVAAGDIGADVLALPSERWLLGPAGLGAIWCGPRLRDRLGALYPDGFADPSRPGTDAAPGHGAAVGAGEEAWPMRGTGWHRPSVVGLARSCGWLSMHVGLEWAWSRASELVTRAARALAAIDRVTVVTPLDQLATVITFRIDGWAASTALTEFGSRVFAIAGLIESRNAIRISLGAWNTEEELDRFVEAVALLAAHSPETLPPRRSLDILP